MLLDIAIARVKSEHVGTTEVLDRIDTAKIKAGMLNPNVSLLLVNPSYPNRA